MQTKDDASMNTLLQRNPVPNTMSQLVKPTNVFHDLFNNTQLSTLAVKTTKLISVDESDTLKKAISKLVSGRVLSAPVLKAKKEGGVKHFIGFVTMVDILQYAFGMGNVNKALKHSVSNLLEHRRGTAQEQKSQVKLQDNVPVLIALEVFNTGVYRVAIYDPIPAVPGITSIFSQTDVIRFVHKHISSSACKPEVKKMLSASLVDLKFPIAKVNVVLLQSATIKQALELLSDQDEDKRVVPVVNDDGQLIGNFSVSDFRGTQFDELKESEWSVGSYLTKRYPASLKPICVDPKTDSFAKLCEVMATDGNGRHQVWVIDPKSKFPKGVIRTMDIIRFLRGINSDVPHIAALMK